MHKAELYALSRVNWQLFCSLTFRSENLSQDERVKRLFTWLRSVAELGGVHFRRLLWCARWERGEALGRLHVHVLIAGLPLSHLNRGFNFTSMREWDGEHRRGRQRGGWAQVRMCFDVLGGVEYMMKGLCPGLLATLYAGDYHELTKFGGSCDVTLSESTVAHLDQRLKEGRRGQRYELWGQTRRPALGKAQ